MAKRGRKAGRVPTPEFRALHVDFPVAVLESVTEMAKSAGMSKSRFISGCCAGETLMVERESLDLLARLALHKKVSKEKVIQDLLEGEMAFLRSHGIHVE